MRIPLALGRTVQLGQQGHHMEPGQLGSRLLPKLAVRAMLGEEGHILEVAAGEAAYLGEGVFQVQGQAFDDFRAPTFGFLSLLNFDTDPEVQLYQLGIDGQRRPLPGLSDVAFKLSQPVGVALRQCRNRSFAHTLASLAKASNSGPLANPSCNNASVITRWPPTPWPTVRRSGGSDVCGR